MAKMAKMANMANMRGPVNVADQRNDAWAKCEALPSAHYE